MIKDSELTTLKALKGESLSSWYEKKKSITRKSMLQTLDYRKVMT